MPLSEIQNTRQESLALKKSQPASVMDSAKSAHDEKVLATHDGTDADTSRNGDRKESIRVLVRVRPFLPQDEDDVKAAREVGNTEPVEFPDDGKIKVTGKRKSITCGYDRVFKGLAKQNTIFDHVQSSVDAVVSGINSTIFAYGQTGSGKTYTMLGKDEDWSSVSSSDATSGGHTGLIPRALSKLFENLALKYGKEDDTGDYEGKPSCDSDHLRQHGTYIVHCSYIQIYNNRIYDLLTDSKMQNSLTIRESFAHDLGSTNSSSVSVFVSGLSQTRVVRYVCRPTRIR